MRRRALICAFFFTIGVLSGKYLLDRSAPVRADGIVPPATDCDVNGDGILTINDAVHIINFLFLGGPAPLNCPPPPVSDDTTVVFLVRHAEKIGDALSELGWVRARHLATLFEGMEIDTLIASVRNRTQETLTPLLESKDTIDEFMITEDRAAAGAAAIRDLPPGSRAVVAHHSYTVGGILVELGAEERGYSFPGGEYDNIWVLTMRPGQKAQAVKFKYCVAPGCPVLPEK